jgi:hypothetical protein
MPIHFRGITAIALATGLATSVADAQCVRTEDGSGVHCQTLLAGQTIEAGSVCVEVVDTDLVVTYSTTGDWELVEAHLWVGGDLADMPQTRRGNPKIGNFPYKAEDLAGATSHQFIVPLDDLGFGCPGDDASYHVAAHAALRRPDGDGGFQTETGWADGDRFVQRGSWATYFTVDLTCECDDDPPPPPPLECETAFAYGGGLSTCFLDIDDDGDGDGDFNRWGWTNAITEEDVYLFDVYAGAGQCDTGKGTLVGTLMVVYVDGTVDVIYEMNEGFEMSEVHLYVGSEMLPRDVNGDYTVAPGQYPYVNDTLEGAASHAILGIPASGPIHVVAHAVVCSDEWPGD